MRRATGWAAFFARLCLTAQASGTVLRDFLPSAFKKLGKAGARAGCTGLPLHRQRSPGPAGATPLARTNHPAGCACVGMQHVPKFAKGVSWRVLWLRTGATTARRMVLIRRDRARHGSRLARLYSAHATLQQRASRKLRQYCIHGSSSEHVHCRLLPCDASIGVAAKFASTLLHLLVRCVARNELCCSLRQATELVTSQTGCLCRPSTPYGSLATSAVRVGHTGQYAPAQGCRQWRWNRGNRPHSTMRCRWRGTKACLLA